MNKPNRPKDWIARATDEELVDEFRVSAIERGRASEALQTKVANRVMVTMESIHRELRARGLTAQRKLAPLLEHDDPYVRVSAGACCLEFDPEKAIAILTSFEGSLGIPALNAAALLMVYRSGELRIGGEIVSSEPQPVRRRAHAPSTPSLPPHPAFAMLRAPQIAIVTHEPSAPVASRSHIGGHPEAPAGFEWPYCEPGPLSFLAAIYLDELPRTVAADRLPDDGVLLFFYDDQSPWGFDPKDRGSWRVHWCRAADDLVSIAPPDDASLFERCALTFVETESYAHQTSPAYIHAHLAADEREQYETFLEEHLGGYESTTAHRMLGYPIVIQGHMELTCERASNGVYCGAPTDSVLGADTLADASEWRLLLQLDSDARSRMEWADNGRLYFWIRETDLAARRFGNVWVILESY